MARFSRMDVLNAIIQTGMVPVYYHADVEVMKGVAKAVAAGGCRLLEFTNRGDFAPDVFKELVRFCQQETPDLMLGAGTIVEEATAALYLAYGANFIVGPSLSEGVARLCNRRKIAYMPGCGSVTEINDAEELGVEIVKLFPGEAVGGPDFVRTVLSPCPWTRIMPTGEIEASRENLRRWFKAGITAVGLGSSLIRKEYLQSGDDAALTARTVEVLAWIREART